MKHLIIFCLLFLAAANVSSAAVQAPDFSLQGEGDTVYRLSDFKGEPLILFFFSFSCGHCETAMPVIKGLHESSDGRYNILGVVFGTSREDLGKKRDEAEIKFPLATGTKKVKEDYRISGTPYIWAIGPDGTLKERFIGGKGAELLEKYLEIEFNSPFGKGGLGGFSAQKAGLFELASDTKGYEGKTIEIGGRLIQTSPSYFPKPVFMLTNGTDRVRVSAWLPLEVAPAPKGLKKQRKKVMSDFLGRYVIISGKVVLEDGMPVIEVTSARIVE